MKNSKSIFNVGFTSPHILSGMSKETPVLLALSGGADSRALLDMLAKYCKESGTPLSVAHVNHMIRGKDAERDRDFCRGLAEKYSLPFYLLEADVPALAKANRRGLEEEARAVRYEFFERVMRENDIPILATAHNATDNAETVIFNLARGSGLHGLCGIPPTRKFGGGLIVRPLLKLSKDEILAYCRDNSLEYVTDSTNSDVAYSRNRIRNNILPELREINENAISNISRACEFLRADDTFIASAAKDFLISLEDRHSVTLDRFAQLDTTIKARVVSTVLGEFFDASAVHVSAVIGLAEKAVPHSSLTLPREVTAKIEDGRLVISAFTKKRELTDYCVKVSLGETVIPEIDGVIVAEEEESAENSAKKHNYLQNIYKKSTTTLIYSDRISEGLFVRPKKEGDKILTGGMHKKLKKLFCDKKIPLEQRNSTPIFCDSNGIIWVPYIALRDSEKNAKRKVRLTFYHN